MRVHHSNRLESLAAELAGLIASNPSEPLAAERIVVPHQTMGRWLRLEIARELGIAANLSLELPAAFAWSILRSALPTLSGEQGFSPDTLRWHLFESLPEFSRAGDAAALGEFLADEDELKRFELADKLAGIFDRCVNFRGDWIRSWERGEFPHWQARLWHLLARKVPEQHWVRALDGFERELAAGHAPRDWPRRAFVFGVSALSPAYLQWLKRLAGHIELHVFLLNPSSEYWSDLRPEREIRFRAEEANSAEQHYEEGNPLLAAWGLAGRDTFENLIAQQAEDQPLFAPPAAHSRLAAVQGDIQEVRGAAEAAAAAPVEPDNSLQIHCCHSAMREAEVLHDRLLDLLETHPDIEPADILILTPNLARYGPAIEAVFEAEGRIPVRLSRIQAADSPTVRAFFDLLSLPGTRYGVESVLAPLDAPSVRARFEIAEEDLPAIRDWVKQAGVRRNLASEGAMAPLLPGNTWRDGFNRLLAGYAAGDTDDLSLGIAPCSIRKEGGFEAGEEDYAILGRFISYCDAAFALSGELDKPGDAEHWKTGLRAVLNRFFDNGSRDDAYRGFEQKRKAAEEFGEVVMLLENFAAEAGRIDCQFSFEVARKALREAAASPSPGPARLADSATIASLAPGQILPAKIICAAGMNNAGFPRKPPRHTFDLVERDERRPGDRDLRHDDRFAFLEALLAARKAFVVTYTGRNQRDDAEIPPSVVVDELHDYLVARFPETEPDDPESAAPARDGFRFDHPLQPFSARYFSGDHGLFSYSPTMLDAARLLRSEDKEKPERFSSPIPEPDVSRRGISLEELEKFFANPARGFLRERFSVRLSEEEEAVEEVEPLRLNGYERWALRDEILTRTGPQRERKVATAEVRSRLLANGKLPYGGFGALNCDQAFGEVEQLRGKLEPHAEALAAEPVYIDVDTGDFRLSGAIPNVGPTRMVWWRNGRQRPIDLIHIRLRQLAWIAAGHRPLPIVGVWIDKERGFSAPDVEVETIRHWLKSWWGGLAQPLRFFPKATVAYARVKGEAAGSEEKAMIAARKAWRDDAGGNAPAECDDSHYSLVWDLGQEEDPFDDEFRALADLLLLPMFQSKPT